MQLKCKETGKLYTVTVGKILSEEKAKKLDATASFITAKSVDGEEIGVVYGYKNDGAPSDNNKYELILDEGEEL